MALLYQYGHSVKQNDSKAAEHYRKSADLNFSPAQWALGQMYAKGQGVPKDDARAVELYRKAAAAGDKDAMKELARRGLK